MKDVFIMRTRLNNTKKHKAIGGSYSEILVDDEVYCLHTFLGGSEEFQILVPELYIEYLLIAGGGAGGTSAYGSGGGGAGGVLYNPNKYLIKGTREVYVGSGGKTSTQNGENSIFGSAIAYGGGGGGKNGGSGGGGMHTGNSNEYGLSIQTTNDNSLAYGNIGGTNAYSGSYPCGSGGGSETAGGRGAVGGNGKAFFITGVSKRYAAGGGTCDNSGNTTAGGAGGGGAGKNGGIGVDAEANTGSGSGGCKNAIVGKGANGILIVRYKLKV